MGNANRKELKRREVYAVAHAVEERRMKNGNFFKKQRLLV
jgi:hypothetical protein